MEGEIDEEFFKDYQECIPTVTYIYRNGQLSKTIPHRRNSYGLARRKTMYQLREKFKEELKKKYDYYDKH